jgi:hypothetical protein
MIKEELLHFLWRSHRIPKFGLQTTQGEYVEIISPGTINHLDGPDFSNAKIRIGGVLWIGPVELHLKSSDWYAHEHQLDERYDPVILHVVLEENEPIYHAGRRLPCLEIKNYLTNDLVHKYQSLKSCQSTLACAPYEIPSIQASFFWMRDRLLVDRFNEKLNISGLKDKSSIYVFYQLLFGALGAGANKNQFMDLAGLVNWSQIERWKNRPERIYTYFKLLSGIFDHEVRSSKEYSVISSYVKESMLPHIWNNRQIRPHGRPKQRILEICALVVHDVFSKLIDSENALTYSECWYSILEELRCGSFSDLRLSDFTLRNIALNAVAPFAFYRGVRLGDSEWFDFALQHLDEWPAERNKIVNLYMDKGLEINSGGDSQALLELYKRYCVSKKCVSCAIGMSLMRA